MKKTILSLYAIYTSLLDSLQPLLLLAIRLYWGWQFFETGKGKLMNLEKVTGFFTGLGIPFPHEQAIMVGTLEMTGGLLLLLGLGARLITIPLMGTLIVAYATADLDRVKAIFTDSAQFVSADEFLFLFAVVLVLVFGPGKFSIDTLIGKRLAKQSV